jgi:hypothetical protein
MQIDEGARHRNGATDNLCCQTLDRSHLRGHCDQFSPSDQVSNPAQQLILGYRTIRYGQRVALRNPLRILRITGRANHTMSAQLAMPPDNHDISDAHSIVHHPLDDQRIPGPDCRKHAPAASGKSKLTKRAQNLTGQFAFQGGGSIPRGVPGQAHDTFVGGLSTQLDWSLFLLQESAEVTKTCS